MPRTESVLAQSASSARRGARSVLRDRGQVGAHQHRRGGGDVGRVRPVVPVPGALLPGLGSGSTDSDVRHDGNSGTCPDCGFARGPEHAVAGWAKAATRAHGGQAGAGWRSVRNSQASPCAMTMRQITATAAPCRPVRPTTPCDLWCETQQQDERVEHGDDPPVPGERPLRGVGAIGPDQTQRRPCPPRSP